MEYKKKQKKNVLVSGCLLGLDCRYDGGSNYIEEIEKLKVLVNLIPVCPEQLGGLTTPRQPSEIQSEKVISKTGTDVTAEYEKGAGEALKLAQFFGCRCAILKARSPSCGSGVIYDGTFSKTKIAGDGKTAELLKANGIRVYTEFDLEQFLAAEVLI